MSTSSHTLVVGLGASGAAAARFLAKQGKRVIATDQKPAERLGALPAELAALGITLELGGHRPASFTTAAQIVLSPGVPSFPELEAARAAGVEVIGEFELAARNIAAPIICITGTNGKSTTTSLIGEILTRTGKPTFVGGNLGQPLIEAAGWPVDGWVVAEVSSFQLETLSTLRAHVAVLLNVTPDHLDRYPSFEAYAETKGNVFDRQTADDFAVVNADDPICMRLAARSHGRVVPFRAAPYPGLTLNGRHNEENAQAAFAAVRLLGVSEEIIDATARSFRALPHRMELVGRHAGVAFYDDSKGTNVGAVVKSLEGFGSGPGKVALILGGRDKGGSYEPLVEPCRTTCRAVLVIGEAAAAITAVLGPTLSGAGIPCEHAATLEQAVARGAAHCHAGDAVLLSPACSSYDMFRDYKERGDRFRQAALALGAVADASPQPARGHR